MDTTAAATAVPIGHPILGYIIPAVIFLISFCVAWACYRHFSRKV